MTLTQIKPNFHKFENDGKVIYFSYERPIAFNRSASSGSHFVVTDKFFSNATSKHKNLIDIDKRFRISHDEFLSIIDRNF